MKRNFYIKNIIFFLLLFLKFYNVVSSSFECFSDEEIFFNILYKGIERSKATIKYFNSFIKVENKKYFYHKKILGRMRNPTLFNEFFDIEEYEKILKEYLDIFKKTEKIYTEYSFLYNRFFNTLNHLYINKFNEMKFNIKYKILLNIYSLNNLLSKIKEIFDDRESHCIVRSKVYDFFSEILDKIKSKISVYQYYKNIYVSIDKILLDKADSIHIISGMFYDYYREFWILVEKDRLSELVFLYNEEMNRIKKEKNIEKVKKLSINYKSAILSDEYLPDLLCNQQLDID